MREWSEVPGVRIIQGDCLDVMPTLEAGSVDAVVTDPPYGLAFMGKSWDHGVPGVDFWAEALRVAKPGAFLVAFGGTRTFHRLTCAIEDAGWEIRDCLSWLFGTGFPKSHDISKAIDKIDASEEQERRRLRFTAWVRSTGVTSRQIDEITNTNMGGHYTTAASQPAIMTREHLEQCRCLLGNVPEWVEREADIRSVESRNMVEREVIGEKSGLNGSGFGNVGHGLKSATIPITAPATPEAAQWQGWGTALKPAWEPIILARKPLDGTVAANVLKHGTGGINVDACRLSSEGNTTHERFAGLRNREQYRTGTSGPPTQTTLGRWPANVLLTHHDDCNGECVEDCPVRMLGEQSGERRSGEPGVRRKPSSFFRGIAQTGEKETGYGDAGTAARYFYTSKASRAERRGSSHPTVKPVAVMTWLVKLVCPPGGTVLDPFAGTGTTAEACVEAGMKCVAIEREAEYFDDACRRVADAAAKTPLFARRCR